MIRTDDGFWFAFDDSKVPIIYMFYYECDEIEQGEVPTVDALWDRYEAMIARHLGQIH